MTSADVFGTREYLKDNYLYRMGAAVLGIYGNSKEDAIYPIYNVDQANEKLKGANKYACDSLRANCRRSTRVLVADDRRGRPQCDVNRTRP